MRTMTRRGFTLVELLLGLIVLGILAGTVTAVVRGAARVSARAMQSLVAGRTLGSLQGFLQQELRDAVENDVRVLAPTRVALSRPIGDAMVCGAAGMAILIPDSGWNGTRRPEQGRDEAWLLIDPVTDDWQAAAITDVVPDRCPADNAPALRLSLAASATGATVVRVMEPVELSAYRSGVADWFGLTPASHLSAVQPFAGPLTPGAVQWTQYPDRLETVLQPGGAPATTVTTPLLPGP
jgi:prepilin-type N-terminal cleavage/methylation domain-containing protein